MVNKATKTKSPEYKVIRGTRREKLLIQWLYNRVVRAVQDKYGVFEGENEDAAPPEYAAMLARIEIVRKFCRIVLYSDHSNGKPALVNADGLEFAIPKPDSSGEELISAYWNWICTDEQVTEDIDTRIMAANSVGKPDYLKPDGEITPEERNDPNL